MYLFAALEISIEGTLVMKMKRLLSSLSLPRNTHDDDDD